MCSLDIIRECQKEIFLRRRRVTKTNRRQLPGATYSTSKTMSKEAKSKLISPTNATASSENCDPNISSGSHKRKVHNRRKASAAAANDTDTSLPSFENDDPSKHTTGQAACDISLVSPPRKHMCSSRRCASKNPEYSVPVTVQARKFLLSKGHTLAVQEVGVCKCCLQKEKGGGSTAGDQSGSTKRCSRCSEKRWSSDENASTEARDSGVKGNEKQTPFDRPMQDGCCISEIEHGTGLLDKLGLQPSSLPHAECENYEAECLLSEPGECFPAADTIEQQDGSPRLMREKEASPTCAALASPTPENSGNCRLNAVLEAFENLSPSREGRVKALVRAFESLMSSSENKDEQQQRKPRGFPLQFTYLSSNQGEKSEEDDIFPEEESGGPEEGDEDVEGLEEGEEGEGEGPQEQKEAAHVSGESVEESGQYSEAESEKGLQDEGTRSDRHQHPLHEFTIGNFAAARKKSSNRNRKAQGPKPSILPTRRPLQKPQTQPAQLKAPSSKPQPFKLRTEERGHMKEQELLIRLRRMLEEEERLRIPLAQGLPWTTDEPEVPYKPPVKENTKALDINLNSELRAMERAEFDDFISEKLLYLEQRRLEEERLRKIAEEEEVKKMRHEMVPKAQLMPYFDRPFRPRRSSKRPTIPKEPQFHHEKQPKRPKCVANS